MPSATLLRTELERAVPARPFSISFWDGSVLASTNGGGPTLQVRSPDAAGHALRVCPTELWIPCHRVVPAGPGFGTYGGHPERREFLLRLEGAI